MTSNGRNASSSAAALWNRRVEAQTYEEQINRALERVADLVAYVRDEHFGMDTLQRYWRNEPRARGTVQTTGYCLPPAT